MFTVLTEWTPGSSSKHMVWYKKAQWRKKVTTFHLYPPFPLLCPIPILEKATFQLEACRSSGSYQLSVISSYALKKTWTTGLKPGFDIGTDELNLLQRPNGQKERRDKGWEKQSLTK